MTSKIDDIYVSYWLQSHLPRKCPVVFLYGGHREINRDYLNVTEASFNRLMSVVRNWHIDYINSHGVQLLK